MYVLLNRQRSLRQVAVMTSALLLASQQGAFASLIASYAMTESSWAGAAPQVIDSTGNGHSGTAVGGADTVADPMFGRVGNFFGNQYVTVGGSGTVKGAHSIVAWVRIPSTASLGMPIITGGSTNQGDFFGIGGSGGETHMVPQYALYVDHWGEGPSNGKWSSVLIQPNQWTFVGLTFDGASTRTFYVNGSSAGSFSAQALYDYSITTYTIGGNEIGGTTTATSFSGQLHDVQIYDEALPADQIHNLYVASIPEPSCAALLLVGILLAGLRTLIPGSPRLAFESPRVSSKSINPKRNYPVKLPRPGYSSAGEEVS